MKNISLSLAALVLCLATVSTVRAQSNAMYASAVIVKNNNSPVEAGGIDARAIKNFKKDFSTVENAKWQQITDGFVTKFAQKDVQYRIGYDLKGDWQYTERIYAENTLPQNVKTIVTNTYFGYDITLVEEITTRQRTVYIVHIENKEWIIKVKVDGSEMESLEEYKKLN